MKKIESPTQKTLSRKAACEAADFLINRLPTTPQAAIMAGTGLGDVIHVLDEKTTIEYAQIPHFPMSTVQSHHGRLVCGSLAGRYVAVMQGRFHLYEGYSPQGVTFPTRVMQALGVETMVLTNASGGLNPRFRTGDIMVIGDHINLTGANPLIGANEDAWGPRFPDMTAAYDPSLQALAAQIADQLDVATQTGVYVGLKGPSLETPAEMRFLKTIGADAVGFSTVMETIAAVHAGMRVLGLSTITNMCLPDALTPASVEDIISTARKAAPKLAALIQGVLAKLDQS